MTNTHVHNGPKDRVLRAFPEAMIAKAGPRRRQVILWPGCPTPLAEALTAWKAWALAAEIVERDMG